MNAAKKCAKCEKTVYPTEQLNCLDKCWHKMCFKCQACNMTLNMKNYKGYEKLPYCNAHYPTTKHTAVAETPEMMRIATNTRNQSLVEYHKDFEQTKDQIHQVADTLEMKRVKDNTKNISQREYHKEFEETKEKIHQVPNTLEMERVKKNTKNISVREYHKDFQESKEHIHQTADTLEMKRVKDNTKNISAIKYHEDFEKHKGTKISVADDPETVRVKKNMETVSNVKYHNELQKKQNMEMMRPQEYDAVNVRRRQPGSISDYDPSDTSQSYNTNTGTPYSAKHQSTKVYDSRTGADPNYNVRHYSSGSTSSMENGSSQRRVGSISDYDPMNERYGSLSGQYSSGGSVQGDPPQPPVSATQDDSGVVADDVPVKEDKLQPKPQSLESSASPQVDNEAPQVLQSEVLPMVPEDKQPPLPESEIPPMNLEDDQPPPLPQSQVPPLEPEGDQPPPLPQSEVPPLELDDDQPPPVPQSEVPPLEPEDDQPPPVPQSEVPQLSQQEDTVQHKEVSTLVSDIDSNEGVHEPEIHGGHPQQYHQPPPQQYNPPPQQYQPQPQQYSPQPQQYQPQRPRPESSGPIYKAMYDYTAADTDEVSFMEGDIIINTHIIDDGWMDGMVKRTGQTGMLPSNYVERV